MKRIYLLSLILIGCVETDLEDPFPPTLMIDNAISEIDFRVSGMYPLSAVYTDDTGEAAEVQISWTSSDDAILSLDENGLATAKKEGSVTITASYNGLEDITDAITVSASREMISISGVSSIRVGKSAVFTANYLDPNGETTTMSPTWSSSNTSVATVDENGQVTAVAEGMVNITASFGNVANTVAVKVLASREMISISGFMPTIQVGNSAPFKANYINENGVADATVTINWSSSSTSIATVDKDGLVTAVAEGMVDITASSGNVSDVVTVEVTDESVMVEPKIQIIKFPSSLEVGTQFTLEASYTNERGEVDGTVAIVWASSNTSVATVDGNGQLTAVTEGMVSITASFGSASAMVAVEITDESEIQITKFASFLKVGEQFAFEASYTNTSGMVDDMAAITWSSSNAAFLSIDENGLATANAEGSAKITAAFQSTSATVDVMVEAANTVTERSGSLRGTGYTIKGDFTINRNQDGDVILTITNYQPDGPGPYFYLSNHAESRRLPDGPELGEGDMSGDIIINVSDIDSSIDLTTYNYLMVWCKPFRVRLGFGEFNN